MIDFYKIYGIIICSEILQERGDGSMWKRKEGRVFLLVNAGLLLLCVLFPLYTLIVKMISPRFSGCMLHDYFFLYCPMCGGTRAISSLLQFRFLDALRYNAFVVALVLVALVLDGIALIRLIQNKKTILRFAGWFWILFAILLVLFGVLRNVCMIKFGIDPLGDLGAFWKIVKK